MPQRALERWRHLAGDQEALEPGTVTVVRGSQGLCPSGWTGVRCLGSAYVIEAGEASRGALDAILDLADPADPEQVNPVLRPVETLGPGELGYLADPSQLEVIANLPSGVSIRESEAGDVTAGLDAMPAEDVEESAIGYMDPILVAERDGELLGVAGHADWPTGVAHIGLVVAPEHRGEGVGLALGAAATRRALERCLFPQWRSATENEASRAIARRLGFDEVGRQFSFRFDER